MDEALKNEEPGTFLIRFSERHAGLFAVGYKIDDNVCPLYFTTALFLLFDPRGLYEENSLQVRFMMLISLLQSQDPEKRVRHYLVRPDDTAGAKKTLPDFLAECAQFNRILQLTIEPVSGEPRLRNFPKDVVLEPYYSKRESILTTDGYDPLRVNM